MKVKISREDLKIMENLKLKKYLNINKDFMLFSMFCIIIASIAAYLVLLFNDTTIKGNQFLDLLGITILVLGFIFILEKKVLKEKVFYKRYDYLLNDFKISVDGESKTLKLSSDNADIEVFINRQNIKIDEMYIMLFMDGEAIGVIPIAKINGEKEDRQLVKLLNKYMGA
ncbi:MAG: hypothetical protein ACRCWM_11870 [Sarcina sp.]